jgi:thioredoxin 1
MAVNVTTDAEFGTQLAEHERVIVKYYADWCGACRLFAPKFRKLSENERFKDILFLDVDAERNPEARKLAGVTNLPFFATFRNGQLVHGDYTTKPETVEEWTAALL